MSKDTCPVRPVDPATIIRRPNRTNVCPSGVSGVSGKFEQL